MKDSTKSSCKRFIIAIAIVMSFAVNVHAGSAYYAYYTRLISEPTGKGQVYASASAVDESSIEWQDQSEIKQVSTLGMVYAYNKPATGYQFAGWSKAKNIDSENDTHEYTDTVVGTDNIRTITSTFTDDPSGQNSSESAVEGLMPLAPNNVFYANFTKVVAKIYDGENDLGSVKISKLANDEGDQITMTATRIFKNYPDVTFDGWYLDNKKVSSDSAYTITVGKDIASYVAKFKCSALKYLDFGEGKLLFFYPGDKAAATFSGDASRIEFYSDSTLHSNQDKVSFHPYKGTYGIGAAEGAIFYGKGIVELLTYAQVPSESNLLNLWSGDNGVSVDTLPVNKSYYAFDLNDGNLKITSGTIDKNQSYVGIPDSIFNKAGIVNKPSVIYTNILEDFTSGIDNVQTSAKSVAPKGIYTIGGAKVNAMKEDGIYIYDGKKIIFRKK